MPKDRFGSKSVRRGNQNSTVNGKYSEAKTKLVQFSPDFGEHFSSEDLQIEILEITVTSDSFGFYEVSIKNLVTGRVHLLYDAEKRNFRPYFFD
jgi:hypothetical protein